MIKVAIKKINPCSQPKLIQVKMLNPNIEKWMDLFEKAVGRPPRVQEIEEGQKADFDLKAIKGITAMGLVQEVTAPELTEKS